MTDAGNKSDLLINLFNTDQRPWRGSGDREHTRNEKVKHCVLIKIASVMFHFCHECCLRINIGYMHNKLFIIKGIGVDKTIYNSVI